MNVPCMRSVIHSHSSLKARPMVTKSSLYNALEKVVEDCRQCGSCTNRCSVLESPGLTLGSLADVAKKNDQERVHVARQCFLCNHCTLECPENISAQETMEHLRHYYLQKGLISLEDYETVLVDGPNLFSSYRSYFGVAYDGIPLLSDCEKGKVDTLFFPGCTLVSYLPDLTQKMCEFLSGQDMSLALSLDCCGSPLYCLGLKERAENLLVHIFDQALELGITRIITVCPGCHGYLQTFACKQGYDIAFVPLPELMEEAGYHIDPASFEGLTFARFDSCHDRQGLFSRPIARMLNGLDMKEYSCSGKHTLCCGYGGLVASYSPEYADQRTELLLQETAEMSASVIVTACPTCSNAFAQGIQRNQTHALIRPILYAELLFGVYVDWSHIHANLTDMWMDIYAR